MTRTVIRPALLALAVVLVTAPSAMAARGFSLGVAAGEVSATGAIVWGHADASGRYTLQEARDLFHGSQLARETLGDAVVDHYTNYADVELAAFNATVTDWERFRGFERM